MSEETKAQIREGVRHPGVWWRGADLPEEDLRPWEGGIQFLGEALKGFMRGFESLRNRFYLGLGEGKVPPVLKSVSDFTTITWDALNDPLIGLFMDRKRYGVDIQRWIMRANATLSPLFILLQCFNFGLTPVQRMIEWMVIGIFADFISTANIVSETKIWAGITPHSQQRGTLQMFRQIGGTIGGLFTGVPVILMGMKDALGITDYQILIFGALIFTPLAIFARWLPTYAKQRVDFSVILKGEDEEGKEKEEGKKLSLRESFAIVKYNKWFLMWTLIWFLRLFTPKTDNMFLYRFLLPKMEFRGKEYGGEMLLPVKNILFSWPVLVLAPFAVKSVKWLHGPLNFIRIDILVILFTHITSYFVGYKSLPRLVYLWIMEGIRGVFENWRNVPHKMIEYGMLDYVEWKTGVRSEGVTEAVGGMIRKLVNNNLGALIGNLITQWTGYQGWDIPVEQQPPRFLNTIWPLMHLGTIAGELITLIFMLWYKHPHDLQEVEADLIERRALAQKMKEEVEAGV